MKTPICDFVRRYGESSPLRLHMPGHKGAGPLGAERLDITEIQGADSLYEAAGIIRESEENASALFGCPTFYSTEGSSQCIRAMLHLAALHARQRGKTPRIAAARNVHKTFLSAAALLDLTVDWLYPAQGGSYLSCVIGPEMLEEYLSGAPEKPAAVYLTSPDYLGALADVAALSAVCHRHGVLLLVDNAHGAYLRFLEPSLHPMDLGADLCCDSAHKTLPVLTGGAYLHISPRAPALCREQAKNALALFGSTSPSYLILQSLDLANRYLAGDYRQKLAGFVPTVQALRERLARAGWAMYGEEPLKLTLTPKARGYRGTELADRLLEQNIVCEFADPDHLVLMLTPELTGSDLDRLEAALTALERKRAIADPPPSIAPGRAVLSIRQATLAPWETVPAERALGRILGAPSVGCPPAVPILVCGEEIDEQALRCFAYYGIQTCTVTAE